MMHRLSDETVGNILAIWADCFHVDTCHELTPYVDKEKKWHARNTAVNMLALVCALFHKAVTAPIEADGATLKRLVTSRSGDVLSAGPNTWCDRERWWL
jgi:hypothetical protein